MTPPSTLGSYRLIAELGRGGMADVFLAAALGPVGSGFTKLAVVKRLRSHLSEDPEFVSMLMDEARITARLNHPNVVQLFEVGESDGEYFLAMEYLEGQPLHRIERRWAQAGSAFPCEVACAVVSDLLAGLHHAHELADYDGTPLAVVHRDVTPHNVFVRYDGTVKVVDFGIAKALGRACETQRTTLKGKVRYMSPEQASGGHVDRRTDIFAAGVILWNLATGQKLWGERSDAEIVEALRAGHFVGAPRELCPDVPEEINAICKRALAFDRADRYESADDMRADLEAFLGRGSAEARKKLAAMMKGLFEADRAKARRVVEASSLMSAPSVDAFTAAAAGSAPPPPQVATPEARSVSPMMVPTSAPAALAANDADPGSLVPTPSRAKAPRSARVLQGIALACVGVLFLALAGQRAESARVLAREPAVVVSDRATSSLVVRLKSEQAVSPAAGNITVRRAKRGPQPVEASPLVVADAAVTSESARSPRKRRALDSADPWTTGPADGALR